MGNEIEIFDFRRMFIGDASAWFLAEVAFRTAFMFVYTLLLVRVLGKRGLSELSSFELLLVVALGSAVGDPMFYADVPLFHAMVVIAVIVVLQKSLVFGMDKSQRLEQFVESSTRRLITDGIVDTEALESEGFSRDELFMLLREDGVEQLGQVKAGYLETSGRVSIWLYRATETGPGLALVPDDDPDSPEPVHAGDSFPDGGLYCCARCGLIREFAAGASSVLCPNCESPDGWTAASFERMADNDGGEEDDRSRKRKRGPLQR